MKKFLIPIVLIFALLVTNTAMAAGIKPGLINVTEDDGSPNAWVKKITFTDGTVVINGSDAEVTIAGVSPGSGSMTTVKEEDTQVGGSDIVTLDFQTGFGVVESPDTEANISLDVTPSTGNATLLVGEDAIQVKYDPTDFAENSTGLLLGTDPTITSSLSIGSDPADAGTLRLPVSGSIIFEDTVESQITHAAGNIIGIDDGTGDSPLLHLIDAGNQFFRLQKMDAGSAVLLNDEGNFALYPSGDTDDWLTITTTSNVPTIGTGGTSDLKITASSGTIDFADENLTGTGTITIGDIIHGADPADTGDIRLSNAETIAWEASAAGTDVVGISVDASEIVQIASSGASGVTITPATTITGVLTTGSNIELGHASDTTIARDSAGVISVEGAVVTLLGATIGAAEVDADVATQAELDAVAALVDTDDEIIAIINASPSTQIGVPAGGIGVGTLNDGGLLVGAGTGAVEVLADGLTTQILVGGGANVNPAWGTDLPTAVTIGTAYVYRVGGTDVADDDVVDTLTASNYLPLAGGTLTGEVVVDNLGLEFTEGDDHADCTAFSATGGGIFYDDSDNKFKKCQNNVLTDLDTDTGGAPALSAVTAPTAAWSISFDDQEKITWSTAQNTAGNFFTIDNTVADVTGQVYLLNLDYSVDDNQALADYIIAQDAGGTVFTLGQNGDVVSTGNLAGATYGSDSSISDAELLTLDDGAVTEILVGGGAGSAPVWGADIPTAVTIGTAYIYRVGGTDVADADVADNITITNISQVGDITATAAEINYTTDVTSNIQAQIDLKSPLASPTFTGIVTIPIAADPTTDADGEISFDTDGWGVGYDALEIWNGTASAYVVATTASDTPANGEIPTFNTGGTITWEAAGTGDVLSVGNCTDGACLDGTSDGGTTISLYDGDSHKLTIDAADLLADATIVLGSDTNNLTITNGTATVDLAAGVDLNLDVDFTADGFATTITGATQANTITLNESFTIGDGTVTTLTSVTQANTLTLNESFTIGDGNTGTLTYSAASKTLTVADNTTLNQDLQTSDAVTFATIDTGQGANELYDMDQNVLTTSSPSFAGLTLPNAGVITFTDAVATTITHVDNVGLLINLELEVDGTLDADGVVALGDGGDNFSVASDGIDIDVSGNITNAGTIGSGAITSTGSVTGTSIVSSAAAPAISTSDTSAAAGTGSLTFASTGAYDVVGSIYVDVAGSATEYMQIDGVAETVDFLKPVTGTDATFTGTTTVSTLSQSATATPTWTTNDSTTSADGTFDIRVNAATANYAGVMNIYVEEGNGAGGDGSETEKIFMTVNGSGASSTSSGTIEFERIGNFEMGLSTSNGTSSAGFIDIYEDEDEAGSNYVRIISPVLASTYTLTLPTTDGNANEILKTDGSGGLSWTTAGVATAWDDLSDPDNNATKTITFDNAAEATVFSNAYDTAGSFFKIDNTDADLANNTYLLHLEYTDDGQANADFLKISDNNGDVKLTIQEEGNLATTGTLQVDGAVTFGSATVDSGAITAIQGAQTGDPQVVLDLTADASGDFSVTTDTGDILLVSAADITLNPTSGNLIFGTSTILSGGDTTSLNLIDAIDATTETTLEAAIDALANLVTVGTVTTGVWNATDIADGAIEDDLTITSTKKISTTLTTEQLRLSYDATNYATWTVGAAGALTLVTVDAGAETEADINFSPDGMVGIKTVTPTVELDVTGSILASVNIAGATYGSDSSVSNAELLYINSLSSNAQDQLNLKAPLASPTFTGTLTVPVGLTGVLRADSGVMSVDSDVTDIVAAASTTAAGKSEIAIASEVDTGTDATRAISPDALAGSNYGEEVIGILVFDDSQDTAVADGAGDVFFRIPSKLNGWNLVEVAAQVQTAGTTGNLDIMVYNVTDAADMLSTAMRIETTETDTSTSAQPGTINGATDDVATADSIRIDIDAVQTTAAKGLYVELTFRLP